MLYFYPKDATTGCMVETCEFEGMRIIFGQNNSEIVGVSKDSLKSHQKFASRYDLGFDLLSDPEGEVIATYGSLVEKSMFGRKFTGIARDLILVSPDQMIHKNYRKVKPDSIAREILESVEED